jgi:hypothetical protein
MNFALKTLMLPLVLTASLSACEVPVMMAAEANQGEMTGMFEITFPAVLLIQFDESEELLTGDLIGRASGSAKFDFTGPTFGHCTGAATKDGDTNMSCANGANITMNAGKPKKKMSGVFVIAGRAMDNDFISAMGWGNLANEATVRQAIADASSP